MGTYCIKIAHFSEEFASIKFNLHWMLPYTGFESDQAE